MKIAIVDDNKMFTDLAVEKINAGLRKLKRKFTYKVTAFTDPFEFIYQYKLSQFDIVFLDQNMPTLRGTEVISSLNNMSQHTQFVFITDHDDDTRLLEALNAPNVLGIYPKSQFLFENIIGIIPYINQYHKRKRTANRELQILYSAIVVLAIFVLVFGYLNLTRTT